MPKKTGLSLSDVKEEIRVISRSIDTLALELEKINTSVKELKKDPVNPLIMEVLITMSNEQNFDLADFNRRLSQAAETLTQNDEVFKTKHPARADSVSKNLDAHDPTGK